MNKEEVIKIVEQFKAGLSLEELDELERQYNEMYKKLREEQSGSIQTD